MLKKTLFKFLVFSERFDKVSFNFKILGLSSFRNNVLLEQIKVLKKYNKNDNKKKHFYGRNEIKKRKIKVNFLQTVYFFKSNPLKDLPDLFSSYGEQFLTNIFY